jgi:hypothetical protein
MTVPELTFSDFRTTVITLTMAQIHRLNGGSITR